MRLSDEQILQRFRSGASTFQIAKNGNVQMTEAEIEAGLHRAQDMEWAAAERGGYRRDLLDSRRQRNFASGDDTHGFVPPDYPQRSIQPTPVIETFDGTAEERAVFSALRATVAPTSPER